MPQSVTSLISSKLEEEIKKVQQKVEAMERSKVKFTERDQDGIQRRARIVEKEGL